jgi:predicted TIM-barrel fold metal-dependent hydrolase
VPVYVHTGPHSASTPTQLVLLAARHPKTRFILGHCGSTDYVGDMSAVIEVAQENVWYETSLARPWAVAAHGKKTAPSKLLFGTSTPRHDPAFELAFLDRCWPIAEHPDTYGGNLLRLLSEVTS